MLAPMTDTAIKVENVSKCYLVGHQARPAAKYTALRDVIGRETRNILRRSADFMRGRQIVQGDEIEEFWALKNISFEIKRGEVLGIIGPNGAGKSTLLKILSRITEPSEGRVTIKGKVASLLEVGTGFHPELTGRENIFLNGAILGMSRTEIRHKFDEIVAFAEVEKFLDTPVKRYSSGMYVRLAFAVAAHIEPDVLLIDEVLAVGDLSFQKKCLGKMSEVSRQGRTVLFVSHQMGAISALTETAIWIQQGHLRQIGPTREVVSAYVANSIVSATRWNSTVCNSYPMQIMKTELSPSDGFLDVRHGFTISIWYVVREPVRGAVVSAIIHALDGTPIISTEDVDLNLELLEQRMPGTYRADVTVPGDLLSPGRYFLRLHTGIVNQIIFDNIEALAFELVDSGNPKIRSHKQAYILPYWKWRCEWDDCAPAPRQSSLPV